MNFNLIDTKLINKIELIYGEDIYIYRREGGSNGA